MSFQTRRKLNKIVTKIPIMTLKFANFFSNRPTGSKIDPLIVMFLFQNNYNKIILIGCIYQNIFEKLRGYTLNHFHFRRITNRGGSGYPQALSEVVTIPRLPYTYKKKLWRSRQGSMHCLQLSWRPSSVSRLPMTWRVSEYD